MDWPAPDHARAAGPGRRRGDATGDPVTGGATALERAARSCLGPGIDVQVRFLAEDMPLEISGKFRLTCSFVESIHEGSTGSSGEAQGIAYMRVEPPGGTVPILPGSSRSDTPSNTKRIDISCHAA